MPGITFKTGLHLHFKNYIQLLQDFSLWLLIKHRLRVWFTRLFFGALTAAGAFIVIPLPPVRSPRRHFFKYFSCTSGRPVRRRESIYLCHAGVVGIPVFAGGKAGLGVIFGPTGGYLLGFIIAAFVIGMVNRMKKSAGIFWHIFPC